jgi:prepilin-type processing-associated H-X9-DG protein
MPRRDDDELDDDDRPRRRRPRDDDEDDDRPARRRRDEDDDYPPPRRKKGNLGLILGIVAGVLVLVCGGGGVGLYFLFKGATAKVGEAAERQSSANNLKQIGLGVLNYESRHGELPNNSYSPDGKPLLSWRVHLLPYIEEEALYRQFHLDEPWDSPNNKPLLARMPKVYATPAERSGKVPQGTQTYYRGFSSPGAIFAKRNPGQRLGMMQVTDGMSNTILVVEAGLATEWTKPDDMDAPPGKPFPALGGVRPKSDTVMVLFCDGSVRAVRRSLSDAQWRAGITYAGGEPVNFD